MIDECDGTDTCVCMNCCEEAYGEAFAEPIFTRNQMRGMFEQDLRSALCGLEKIALVILAESLRIHTNGRKDALIDRIIESIHQ